MSTLNNTFGVTFFLKKQIKNQNGKSPVYARITVNGKRAVISVKQSIFPRNWNAHRGMAKGNIPEIVQFNGFLERFRAGIVRSYQELLLERRTVTAELLKNRFIGADSSEYTIGELMDYHNQDQQMKLKWGTMKNYYTTQNYLRGFLKEFYGTSNRYLSDLNYQFISDFEHFLRSRRDKDGKPVLQNNGVMKHLERLHKMVNLAVRLEWLPRDPFASHRLKFDRVERQFLTAEELQRIEEKSFAIDRLDMVKDLFVFSCYTGLAYVDVINLTPSALVPGIDGEKWLSISREKTGTPVKVPLLPKPCDIIEKYSTHPKIIAEGKLLPTFSNQRLNGYLKEIADLCAITKPLTFHIARHTFATTVTLSNGVPIESVSKMLGHSKLTTTQVYAKVIERKLSEDMQRLRQTLNAQVRTITSPTFR